MWKTLKEMLKAVMGGRLYLHELKLKQSAQARLAEIEYLKSKKAAQ